MFRPHTIVPTAFSRANILPPAIDPHDPTARTLSPAALQTYLQSVRTTATPSAPSPAGTEVELLAAKMSHTCQFAQPVFLVPALPRTAPGLITPPRTPSPPGPIRTSTVAVGRSPPRKAAVKSQAATRAILGSKTSAHNTFRRAPYARVDKTNLGARSKKPRDVTVADITDVQRGVQEMDLDEDTCGAIDQQRQDLACFAADTDAYPVAAGCFDVSKIKRDELVCGHRHSGRALDIAPLDVSIITPAKRSVPRKPKARSPAKSFKISGKAPEVCVFHAEDAPEDLEFGGGVEEVEKVKVGKVKKEVRSKWVEKTWSGPRWKNRTTKWIADALNL